MHVCSNILGAATSLLQLSVEMEAGEFTSAPKKRARVQNPLRSILFHLLWKKDQLIGAEGAHEPRFGPEKALSLGTSPMVLKAFVDTASSEGALKVRGLCLSD